MSKLHLSGLFVLVVLSLVYMAKREVIEVDIAHMAQVFKQPPVQMKQQIESLSQNEIDLWDEAAVEAEWQRLNSPEVAIEIDALIEKANKGQIDEQGKKTLVAFMDKKEKVGLRFFRKLLEE